MKRHNGLKICSVFVGFIFFCPNISWGDLPILFSDDFDNGDFDGWSLTHPISGYPTNPPDVVPSPQGYSLRGVGSGYSPDPGLNVWLTHPFSVTNANEIKIEMRAKSGPQWPNQVNVYVIRGSDYYHVCDYGELGENETADWYSWVDGSEQEYRKYIGSLAFEWHDFAWTRDSDGWWSLSIDDVVVWENFGQDNQLTSFDKIGIEVLRNQSEIEWVKISGPIQADIDIDPDTLNLNSKGKWITCYIELSGDYDVDDIDVSTIKLNDQVPAESHPTGIGDEDDDGVPDLMVKFDRAAVQQILQAGDEVEITVTGELEDETPFEGSDTIRVIDKGGKK